MFYGEPFNGFKFPDTCYLLYMPPLAGPHFLTLRTGHSHHRAIEGRIQSQGREREKTCITKYLLSSFLDGRWQRQGLGTEVNEDLADADVGNGLSHVKHLLKLQCIPWVTEVSLLLDHSKS